MHQRLGFNRYRQTIFGFCSAFAMMIPVCVVAPFPTAFGQDVSTGRIDLEPRSPGATNESGTASAEAPEPFRLDGPTIMDRNVARAIARMMPLFHVSTQKLDDIHSRRALDLFTSSLDPLKLYFYQSDIDQFSRYSDKIDDMVNAGDLSLAFTIFNRFMERIDARVATAQSLLDGEFQFDIDETINLDVDDVKYAKTPEESRDRWRRQIKYALLDLKDEGKEGAEAVEILRGRYSRYARRWRKTDTQSLVEMYLTAVTTSFDPHSTYMAPRTLEDFQIIMSLNLDGIGAQLREKDGNTVITRVIPGGAADKHGKLKPDDIIVSVGQGDSPSQPDADMIDVVEMPLNDVVDKIRGRAGTTVRLGVKKGGVGDVVVYQIVRARIELEESAARGEVIEHASPDGTGKLKIGYINLPSFYADMQASRKAGNDFRSSTQDVQRIIERFKLEGIDGIVLDLSKNGGGSLTEAINLTGLFIDRGPVVQVRNPDGSVQKYDDTRSGTSWDGPLVVMTSQFSASASEILAGAIQDYRRGIIVGDPKTHGKGSVQQLMDLGEKLFRSNRENLGALKVTLQQFYLPDGQSTQLQGVAADIVLPSITAKMDVGESDLKYALEHGTVKKARHDVYRMVPQDLVGTLRQRSMTRVGADEEFQDLLRRVKLYVEQKERKEVSLDEEEFLARRKELNADKEEEDEELKAEVSAEVIYRDSFYNREILNVTHDYIEGLRRQNLARAR